MCTYQMISFVSVVVLGAFIAQCTFANPGKDYIMAYIPVDELPNLAAMNIEVIPIPHYQTPYLYNPWYSSMMMGNTWSPYPRTTGSVYFGGQVDGRGGVSIRGDFGNNGQNKVTSYSTPSSPVVMIPEPTLLDLDGPVDSILPNINLPKVTTLPEIAYPSFTKMRKTADMPSPVPKIHVPDKTLPIIMALSSLAEESFIEIRNLDYNNDDEKSGPVVFGGKVPASGRIKISANF